MGWGANTYGAAVMDLGGDIPGDTTVNGPFNGLFYGGGLELLKDQFVAAAVVGAFSFVMTYLIAAGEEGTEAV